MDLRRPNLVFVLADQLRRQSVGYAGDTRAQTPRVDRLATESVSFDQAVATGPVCAAMRASMLTGTHPSTNGMAINELRLHPAQRCVGHVLTDGGYDTGYIGKWHLYANELGNHGDPKNSFVPPGPHRLGFDQYWAAYNFHHRYYEAWYHTDTPDRVAIAPGVYEPDAQTDLAATFIRDHAGGERPFALFLSYGTPHDPWDDANAPEADRLAFDGVDFGHPPNYSEADDPYGDFWSRLFGTDRDQLPAWRRNYYAMTRNVDTNVGRLLDLLDELGLARDTVFVFTSDHGELFGAHGRRAKNIFYEEAVRVPFLVRWPGQLPPGTRTDACLGSIDIAPTLAGLLGLDAAESWEGTDLTSVARTGVGGPDLAVLQGMGPVAMFSDGHEWRAVRTARHTYARYRVDGAEHLYDNQEDPFQLTNLAADPGRTGVLRELRTALGDRLQELGDSFESSTWYERHWTDGQRNIVAGARGPFGAIAP